MRRSLLVLGAGLLVAVGCEARHQRSTFFGLDSGDARRVVYVMDRSGSMTDQIKYVKEELKRSIATLREPTAFTVIFYSTDPPFALTEKAASGAVNITVEEYTATRLFRASDRNKRLAFAFVDRIIPQGLTYAVKALELAFEMEPDVVFFLSDGTFDEPVLDLPARLNASGPTTVHTIGYLDEADENALKKIAEENGGRYKRVSAADLATAPQAQGGQEE